LQSGESDSNAAVSWFWHLDVPRGLRMDEASSYVEGVIGRLLMNECLLVTYRVLFAIA